MQCLHLPSCFLGAKLPTFTKESALHAHTHTLTVKATLSIDEKSLRPSVNRSHLQALEEEEEELQEEKAAQRESVPDQASQSQLLFPPSSNPAEAGVRQDHKTHVEKMQIQAPPRVIHTPKPAELNYNELIASNMDDQNALSTLCNVMDTLVNSVLSLQELASDVDPAVQLSGNFCPVGETPPTECREMRGQLPPDLSGIYIRNGPNAVHVRDREGYHSFDGDGMLHAVRIKSGRATYCARYVKTSRHLQEEAAARPLFPKFFGALRGLPGVARMALMAARVAAGLVTITEGWGLSNTSVGYFNGQVLSMSEDDMPYVVRVTEAGDLETAGRVQFRQGNGWPKINMCAHPKVDPATGEMVAFGINPAFPPFSVFRVSADGILSGEASVPLLDVPLVHDFAITRRFVVFPDSQFVVRPWEFVAGRMPVVCDGAKVPRLGLLPRYGTASEVLSEARWFDVPGCNCLHYVNAWEDGDDVVLVTSILSPPERFLEIPATGTNCTLTEVRLNVRSGRASRKTICEGNFEFGTINQKYVGRRSRYAYLASGFYPGLTGVVKVDLQEGAVVGRREFGPHCHGNEPFFVPRRPRTRTPADKPAVAASGAAAAEEEEEEKQQQQRQEEDDGYLLCFVHNNSTQVSELLVMDARSPSLHILSAITLPSRVPYGFHGFFIDEEQLASQFGPRT